MKKKHEYPCGTCEHNSWCFKDGFEAKCSTLKEFIREDKKRKSEKTNG